MYFDRILACFIIIIIIRVMCMSGHFCYTRLFSNSPFSVLCSKKFKVMKLAATRYGKTNVDIHPFYYYYYLMFRFIYFNGFLTTGGGESYCLSSISRVVKGKIVHFVDKLSNFAHTLWWLHHNNNWSKGNKK